MEWGGDALFFQHEFHELANDTNKALKNLCRILEIKNSQNSFICVIRVKNFYAFSLIPESHFPYKNQSVKPKPLPA